MNIAHQRLQNQRLAGHRCPDVADAVRWLGAVQAQDYGQALWGIGARVESATVEMVEQAIASARIVRTWPMRGTIHFVPAEDTRWMLELMASRMLAADQRRLNQLELSVEIMTRCDQLLVSALSGHNRLTRAEALLVLETGGVPMNGQRGYHTLWYLAQSGVICSGPMDGKEQTFVLLDEWVPEHQQLSRDDALIEIARRYFLSHGPATVYDFARWTGLTVTDSRQGLAAIEPELIAYDIDGDIYYSPAQTTVADDVADSVHLLAGFDEYVIGYKDRRAIVADAYAQQIVPGNNGVFKPTIVVDGQVVGVWNRKIKRNQIDVTLTPFTADEPEWLDSARSAAALYCDFMGVPANIIG